MDFVEVFVKIDGYVVVRVLRFLEGFYVRFLYNFF